MSAVNLYNRVWAKGPKRQQQENQQQSEKETLQQVKHRLEQQQEQQIQLKNLLQDQLKEVQQQHEQLERKTNTPGARTDLDLLREVQGNLTAIRRHLQLVQPPAEGSSVAVEDETDAKLILSAVLKKVVDQSKQLGKDVEATTKKVKDRTAMVGTSVKGASHWVAAQTSKSAKQAMLQARSGLSLGEKTTLFLTEKISAWSRKGFTHVFMFLMIAAYTALGAALFIIIEGPHETTEKLLIAEERSRLIEDLYVEARVHTRDTWAVMAKERLRPFEDQLYESYKHGVSSDTDTRVWTFWKAMFFCSTITTTIGYGHMSPVTTAGRALCIVYAIIGIPLMLILMADFGKLFTRILRSIFRLIGRVNRSARCVKLRNNALLVRINSGQSNTVHPTPRLRGGRVQCDEGDLAEVGGLLAGRDSDTKEAMQERKIQSVKLTEAEIQSGQTHEAHVHQTDVETGELTNSEKLLTEVQKPEKQEPVIEAAKTNGVPPSPTRLVATQGPETQGTSGNNGVPPPQGAKQTPLYKEANPLESGCTRNDSHGCMGALRSVCRKVFFCKCGQEDLDEASVEDGKKDETTLEELVNDDNFNLPISLALLILLIYIIIGCVVFPLWEDWTFFEAFYFIFISISTIGFGDFVPQHPGFMMATTVYFLFGLALTAMCINIIQETLTNTFREASVKMKQSFSNIMAKAEQEAEEAAAAKKKETESEGEGSEVAEVYTEDKTVDS